MSVLASTAFGQPLNVKALPPVNPRRQAIAAPASAARVPASTTNNTALTQQDVQHLSDVMQRLTPKERKQLTKAIKQLTPAQRKQLVESIRNPAPAKSLAESVKRAEIKKVAPLPPRLAY